MYVSVLVGLYEEPDRPPNAVDYIKRYMGAPTGVDVEALRRWEEKSWLKLCYVMLYWQAMVVAESRDEDENENEEGEIEIEIKKSDYCQLWQSDRINDPGNHPYPSIALHIMTWRALFDSEPYLNDCVPFNRIVPYCTAGSANSLRRTKRT